MIVIACLNSKGGVGKTTLATALAVRASRDSRRVCIVDLDPQESTQIWHGRRGNPDNPALFRGAERASDAVEALDLNGYDWVFLDGPPGALLVTEDAISVSTLVVIPVRASGLDIDASREVVGLCEEAETPFLVVINAARGARDKLVEGTRDTLFNYQLPIADTAIALRNAHVTAMMVGRTAAEKDKDAAAEIDALWREIKAAAQKAARKAKKGGAA